jgi:PBP1b-binding outer membrane lipoprotein LpoB
MKKVSLAILSIGIILFSSCGGNKDEAAKATADSLAAVAKEDSIKAAEAMAQAASADSLAAIETARADSMA